MVNQMHRQNRKKKLDNSETDTLLSFVSQIKQVGQELAHGAGFIGQFLLDHAAFTDICVRLMDPLFQPFYFSIC